MKTKSIAGILMALCLLTGCNDTKDNQTNLTTEKVTDSAAETTTAAETTKNTTIVTSEGGGQVAEITDVSETEKRVFFYRDNMNIFGKLYLPEGEGPFPVAILSSGFGMTYIHTTAVAMKFADNGIAGVVFDFTGSARGSDSDGLASDLSVLTETADLNAVIDVISSMPEFDNNNIFLWGHSLGGLTSTYVAEQRPDDIKGLIAVEPAYQLQDTTKDQFPEGSEIPDKVNEYGEEIYKKFYEDALSVDVFSKMADYDRNVLIFKATEGPGSVGVDFPEYYDRAVETFPSAQLITVDGANHCFMEMKYGSMPFLSEQGIQMIEKSIEFIKNNMN